MILNDKIIFEAIPVFSTWIECYSMCNNKIVTTWVLNGVSNCGVLEAMNVWWTLLLNGCVMQLECILHTVVECSQDWFHIVVSASIEQIDMGSFFPVVTFRLSARFIAPKQNRRTWLWLSSVQSQSEIPNRETFNDKRGSCEASWNVHRTTLIQPIHRESSTTVVRPSGNLEVNFRTPKNVLSPHRDKAKQMIRNTMNL